MPEADRYLQFAHPLALWLLAGLPPLAWVLWRAVRKRREAVAAFASAALAPRLILGRWPDRSGARSAACLLALACLALAAARPKLGARLERVQRQGVDILVALDTSDSMLAQDAQPSRLEAAKREVLGLIARLRGDRIGVVTFSTQAFLYCPLTVDYDAAAMFVESIDAGMISGGGTALAAALRECTRAFQAGEGDSKAVVLISDGEDWEGGAQEAAKALAAKGVRLFAIGVGTEEGAPVPVLDREGRQADVRREQDQVVVTRLNASALKGIASLGQGSFFPGGTADLGATAVYNRLAAMESGRAGSYTFKTYAERFQVPLAAALLLLGLDFLLGVGLSSRARREAAVSTDRPRAGGLSRAGLSTLLLVALAAFLLGSGFSLLETAAGLCRRANRFFAESKFAEALQEYTRALDLDPENPLLRFNSGDALYRQGKLPEAREQFAKAGSALPGPLASAAQFNTGNAFLREQNTDAAIEAYKNALRCDPGNALAKRNLELALRRKQQQQQQPQDQQKKRKPQPEQQPKPQPSPDQQQKTQPQPAQATPMSPDEARALLRQAQYEDAQLQREIARVAPRPTKTTGKDW